jgi:hypothetical protein
MRQRVIPATPIMRLGSVLLVSVFWPISLLAQRPHTKSAGRSTSAASSAAAASVEGDVYLLTKSGDVKKGAAGAVHLIKWPIQPGFGERFESLCADQSRRFRKQSDADSVARAGEKDPERQMVMLGASMKKILATAQADQDEQAELIATLAVAHSPTGMNAHYQFKNVPPGRYVLYTRMSLGERMHAWYVPISVLPNAELRQDLDNNNVDHTRGSPCDTHVPLPLSGTW